MFDWVDFLVKVAEVLLPVVIGAAVVVIRPFVQAQIDRLAQQIGVDRWNAIRTFVNMAVAAAEQITGLDTGDKKKAYVSQLVHDFVDEQGWNAFITDAQIDALIEAAVRELDFFN